MTGRQGGTRNGFPPGEPDAPARALRGRVGLPEGSTGRRAGLDPPARTVIKPGLALGDHGLTLPQALADHRLLALDPVLDDGAYLGGLAVLDDVDELAPGALADCPCGDDQGVALYGHRHPDVDELARPEPLRSVRERPAQ